MSLWLPAELIADRVIPTLRGDLATELHDRGLTQQEIADRLGVTQASVSKYLSGEFSRDRRIAEYKPTRDTIDRVATGLVDGSMTEVEMLAELLALIEDLEDRGPLCEIHEEKMPSLQGIDCDLCHQGNAATVLARRSVIRSVRRAADEFKTIPNIAPLIPNVGVNIGMTLQNPTDTGDVAAIPGRIKRVGGSIRVPGEPEFGASEHVAKAILAANTVNADIRGGLNLATDDEFVEAARERGLQPLEVAPEQENRAGLLRSFEQYGAVPHVCYHRGAHGTEPITFVFGHTAEDAVKRVAELAAVAG